LNIFREITRLADFCVEKGIADERDRIYSINRALEACDEDGYEDLPEYHDGCKDVEAILDNIRQWAVESGRVENDSIDLLDLFDTKVIAAFIKTPSEFERDFWKRYETSPESATLSYYDFARNSNYIRVKRVEKDIRWSIDTEYGPIDMTINLSKPEKDPRAIAKAKLIKDSFYPKCLICKENEGYAGRLNHPARGSHRMVSLKLAGEDWFMQYSPYVYYNEHCIVLKADHEPMKVTEKTFSRLLDFNRMFPHYFIGSNADLPIVGGSILTHDHFQGGNYEFPMARAKELDCIRLKDHDVEACTLFWPMSVIRLKGRNIEELVEVSGSILSRWKHYSDESVGVISHTNSEGHNTVTPITRFRNGLYEVDIVLRNNRTDDDHPFGIFHSAESHHHIKRENIGLIEAMGLAVLPARLKKEMDLVRDHILANDIEGIFRDDELEKHGHFALKLMEEHTMDKDNADNIIYEEIGKVFLSVLKDAGVFKGDNAGREAFRRCCEAMYEGL
jgi:UDPglucose--hexose-1-phosphate uridylyltransferase